MKGKLMMRRHFRMPPRTGESGCLLTILAWIGLFGGICVFLMIII